ncbi:YfgJ family double zinc ribbon protein [Cellulosilyticum sp. I15G10I2]|uniref:YfgJ family double zinc ribbon protein n=1 Tax=Cellulosilyticum sp. I15G10I2 TaxID=1892843 RepID=UPI00085BC3F9|nr:zinc-ribbon domain-containing protein [Cellulosilyticum sp. I15G10I2]
MEETFYCPDCNSKLERLYSCGSDSYICNACRKLVSRKTILTEKDVVTKVVELVVKKIAEEKL